MDERQTIAGIEGHVGNALVSLVKESLLTKDLEILVEQIKEINQEFFKMDRSSVPPNDLIIIKYLIQHWRFQISNRLKKFIKKDMSLQELRLLVEALVDLNLKLSQKYIRDLESVLKQYVKDEALNSRAKLFYANQNQKCFFEDGLDDLTGPTRILPIVGNRASRCTMQHWSKDKRFCNYRFIDKHRVEYRGMVFTPGDAVLANINLDGNGVFTAFSKPRNYAFHSGCFAVIDLDGDRYPVVMESYELGVRAVPLSTFCGPKFTSYAEVYSLKEQMSDQQLEKINAHSMELIKKTNGYNFDTEDDDKKYLACTRVGSELFIAAGVEPISVKSRFEHPMVIKNCEKLGLFCRKYYFPVDYMIDERMKFVGMIDNNHLALNVARELSDRKFKDFFMSYNINLRKLPLLFVLTVWTIGQIRSQTLMGKILGFFRGFNPLTLPKGNPLLVAMIDLLGRVIGKLERRIADKIEKDLEEINTCFYIDSFEKTPHIQELYDNYYFSVKKWFDSL